MPFIIKYLNIAMKVYTAYYPQVYECTKILYQQAFNK